MMTALLVAAALIEHLPPAQAPAGEPLSLAARVGNAQELDSLDLHWRRPHEPWRTVAFGKDEKGRFAVVIAASDVVPPAIEYYVTAGEKGAAGTDRFASARRPHPVVIKGSPQDLEREDRLLRHGGHTSSAMVTGELVDFGAHDGYTDRYYVGEASYTYRLLGPVQHIRLGVGTLRGNVPPPGSFMGIARAGPGRHTGLDYGYGELAFNGSDFVGLTIKLLLGADELGFSTGAGGVLRIGGETLAHAELGAQVMQRFGYDSWLRIVWDTVPRWPIGLAVHVTNMPKAPVSPDSQPDNPVTDSGAPTGIRVLLDAGFHATDHVTLLLKGGYQARFSTDGGATLGGGLAVEW